MARALLPGPLTLILPNPERRFRWLAGSSPDTIGVRVPELRGAARRSSRGSARSPRRARTSTAARTRDDSTRCRSRFAGEAVLVDGGELPGTPSTVVDLTGDEPKILREGAVPAADVLALLR